MEDKMNYDELIDALREVKPILNKPEELTNEIIENLPKQKTFTKKGINIIDNGGRWNIFIGFRSAAAVAAVFLVGYFAFQQWEITAKVSKLEEEVNYRKNNVLSNEKIENISTSYYQSLLERQPGLKQALLAASKEMKVPFEMNGDDINQLVKEIGRLEEENRQLKSALLNHLVDSLRKSRGNYLKSKSL